MRDFYLRRLVSIALTLLGVGTLIFLLVRAAPGDPATILGGEASSGETLARLRTKFALDRPLHVQYLVYLGRMLRADFGLSFRTGLPVTSEISSVLPYTLELVTASILISIFLGVSLGLVAARRRGSLLDTIIMGLAVLAASIPAFWVGLLLLLAFAYRWPLFPVLGGHSAWNLWEVARHLALPALAVGLRQGALTARITRASVLDTIEQDYVRVAQAKGLPPRQVMVRHVLRNAAIPIMTIIGLEVGYVMGGSIVTEIVFSRPGLGTLLLQAIQMRDYPVVQGVVLLWGVMFLSVNLLVDFSYPFLDPRLRQTT